MARVPYLALLVLALAPLLIGCGGGEEEPTSDTFLPATSNVPTGTPPSAANAPSPGTDNAPAANAPAGNAATGSGTVTPTSDSAQTGKTGEDTPDRDAPIRATMKTSMGTIELELWPDKAPATVENFIRYAKDRFYNGTIFHRVVPNFVIQGGGFTQDLTEKPTRPPIRNEASTEARNQRGTIAMARTSDPHSATSQFYINLRDNSALDRDQARDGWGYTVFGKVVRGMDVVDRIANVPTRTIPDRGLSDVPRSPVVIESVTIHERR